MSRVNAEQIAGESTIDLPFATANGEPRRMSRRRACGTMPGTTSSSCRRSFYSSARRQAPPSRALPGASATNTWGVDHRSPGLTQARAFLDKAARGYVWASVTCLALHRRAQGSGPGGAYVHDNVFLALTTGENSQSPYQAGSCRHFPPLSPTVRSNQRERRVSQWSHGLTSGRPVVELGRPSP